MKITDGPFGVVEETEGCWNRPWITFYSQKDFDSCDKFGRPQSSTIQLDAHWPKMRGGCSGLVLMENGDWHYMGEDDDHYWTTIILTDDDLHAFLRAFRKFDDNIVVRINYVKCKSHVNWPNGKKRFPSTVKEGRFTFESQLRKDHAPLVNIRLGDKEITSYDVSHLKSQIKFLEAAVEYIGSDG